METKLATQLKFNLNFRVQNIADLPATVEPGVNKKEAQRLLFLFVAFRFFGVAFFFQEFQQ